jgi:hypothetical protein
MLGVVLRKQLSRGLDKLHVGDGVALSLAASDDFAN